LHKKIKGTFQNKFRRCRKRKSAGKAEARFSNAHTAFHAPASVNPCLQSGNHSNRMAPNFLYS
jgi:hypothetical protein